MARDREPGYDPELDEAPDPPRPKGIFRPKGNISPLALTLLAFLGLLPIALAFCRVLAMPDVSAPNFPGSGLLSDIGRSLNLSVTLEWMPPADRPSIQYLLLLPVAALMVALVRLTFGIRVLGFRAILIAIGFRESGFMPSLILMAIVVGTIIAIRPSIRKMKLPLYARITVILCVAAMIMVGAVLLAPQLRSEAIWGVAFFPVIILAMLAEGIARTLENDNLVTAIWRAGWTILLAIVIALVTPSIGSFMFYFPEFMLTSVIAIVLVSEFFDLRLLEAWPERLTRFFEGVRPWYHDKPRIALVRNRKGTGFVGRLGRPAPEKYRKSSVQRLVNALREEGYRVKVFEGDMTLPRELLAFIPAHPLRGTPGGMVLNLSTGVQGNARFTQVPAMLEMAGVAYSGPDPNALARLCDRLSLMTLLREAGVETPGFALVEGTEVPGELEFPLMLHPRFEPDARPKTVRDAREWASALRRIRRRYGDEVVAEELPTGRELRVALLGNDEIECLPPVEIRDGEKQCPAPISESEWRQVQDSARSAYRASGCRDLALVEVRLTAAGPMVDGIAWTGLFARRGSLMTAAEVAGYSYAQMLRRLVGVAAQRYGGRAEPTAAPDEPTGNVVSLADRRAAPE